MAQGETEMKPSDQGFWQLPEIALPYWLWGKIAPQGQFAPPRAW
jgi:hypothetical protein